jgi:hypothetical protein
VFKFPAKSNLSHRHLSNIFFRETDYAGSISNSFVTLSLRNEISAADNELKTKKVKL